MPNATDTDVLAGGGADTTSDVTAPSGTDPGADISMQDVSGATPMASPLGGQQPGQLPPMVAGAPPQQQTTPVGAMVHHRHGGLLTGLAGVLLDGIAAGVMTPQSGQGFAQAAQRAYYMPQERLQNQMAMQQFQTQQELDKAKLSQAHVTQLQSYVLANRLTDEQLAGVTDDFMKNVDDWTKQDLVDLQSTTPSREEAAQQVNQLRTQLGDKGDEVWMWPTAHDDKGVPTTWGIYRMNPDKEVGRDTSITVPWVDEQGNPTSRELPIGRHTKMRDLAAFHNEQTVRGLMSIDASNVKAKAAAKPGVAFNQQTGERVIVRNEAEANAQGLQGFVPNLTEPQVEKFASQHRQFNEITQNISSYRAAAQEFAAGGKASDGALISTIINENKLGGEIKLGQFGDVQLPLYSSVAEAADRVARSTAYEKLSQPGKDLVDAYIRSLSAMPSYQKALTESGRFSREMLQLELRNIPDPTHAPADIDDKLSKFERNVDQGSEGIPRVLGIDTVPEVRAKYGPQGPLAPARAEARERARTGTTGGTADPLEGRTASAPGKPTLIRRGGQWVPQQ